MTRNSFWMALCDTAGATHLVNRDVFLTCIHLPLVMRWVSCIALGPVTCDGIVIRLLKGNYHHMKDP